VQDQVIEHLREYLADMQDEMIWDTQFERTQPQLAAAARLARQQIADGLAQPLDFSQL